LGKTFTMRTQSVNALIQRAESQLTAVSSAYEKSLHEKHVEDSLKIDIKNLCENLRSSLDYVAHDIREKHCPTATGKFYFPILPNAAAYAGQMAQWYPGLQTTAPKVHAFLESIQPYKNSYAWLGLFNRLNNENKHGNLVEQTRTETHQITVTNKGGGGSVSWGPGVTFGGGVSIMGVPINPSTQLPVPHASQTVKKMIWVDFRFAGIDASAITLLSDSINGVKAITASLYAII
jgi:hypothetical protein